MGRTCNILAKETEESKTQDGKHLKSLRAKYLLTTFYIFYNPMFSNQGWPLVLLSTIGCHGK